MQGVQRHFAENVYTGYGWTLRKNRLTESSRLTKRSSIKMHCKVCSPIWNTRNFICILMKKKRKERTLHSFFNDFDYLLQNFASLFTDISSAAGLYRFICGGEPNHNVNYSQGKEISCPHKLKNDLDRLLDFN